MVAKNEKSPKFSQLLLFSFVKQRDSLLIEGSKLYAPMEQKNSMKRFLSPVLFINKMWAWPKFMTEPCGRHRLCLN